ncbi:MAG: response regulator transcription factor [Chitinophagaceae bacterium]|jgi:two-component system invasion response regulator UvrY|nr:response regulator transcription factor [Chitinophagaceae bacterium]MBP6047245.1 response regulator transcription factor [Ferruginibacter sp.]NMD28133.1 response regulator transcription factor [Bacteroidota bacterium]MBK7089893.1 response regulator transcription factor [Chitinophagaceae bacterium]MBK7736038.1 response regulator transcription factor [Chitinophagaceae bacterium]
MRFLIADDHTIVRRGLRQILLEGFPDAEIEEVPDAEELIKNTIQSDWDIIISDLSMPGRSGLEALQQIKQIKPKIPVLILSIHPEEQYALRVLKAGAAGYLSKDLAPDELVNAVNRVLLGKKYITVSIAEKLASVLDQDSDKQPHELLSDREFSVLKLLATGKSVSEIAESMFLSVTTVSTYRARIMAKMNLKTNADLILYSIEHKLL